MVRDAKAPFGGTKALLVKNRCETLYDGGVDGFTDDRSKYPKEGVIYNDNVRGFGSMSDEGKYSYCVRTKELKKLKPIG